MSLYQVKSGVYYVDIAVKGGKRIRHSTGTRDTALAQEYHDHILAKLNAPPPPVVEDYTGYEIDELVIRYLPSRGHSGIYFLISQKEIVYVGQSVNIHKRVSDHFSGCKIEFDSYSFIFVPVAELNRVEKFYIQKFMPAYNVSDNPLDWSKRKPKYEKEIPPEVLRYYATKNTIRL